ncbi:nucleotidyltransferase family protein [Sphingomonas colocasiae]|uniref:Nucleotidyltransferase family protein n=2 Tax=Sphingomonas colocasiae TaxID=1848973 RepID=A0ABS7PUB5_9SPHN|nr:nucleotidyltransferase family protein [Sphingomonas colocasiae]
MPPRPRAGGWTAIVLAGRRPGVDPLARQFGQTMKSLIRVDGEAMVSRVVRTLRATPAIGRVLVMAQDPGALAECADLGWIRQDPGVRCTRSGDGISRSILDFLDAEQAPFPLLITTADNVLLTPEMVNAFVGGASGADISVGLVDRPTMMARYPGTQRTWLKFRGGAYTGANLFALRSPAARSALEVWQSVEQDRKKLLRIAGRFGPALLLRVLTRTISLHGAIARAGDRLGVRARPVLLAHAEAGIDVDKPSDHAMAEAILRERRSA